MKLLLDTHTFLWFVEGNLDLSSAVRTAIDDPTNPKYLSIASLWEMSIKTSLGKLELEIPFTELVRQHVYGNAIGLLEIRANHLDELAKLPFHHKDPFDRLMIVQAITENMAIVTRDSAFGSYPVRLLW